MECLLELVPIHCGRVAHRCASDHMQLASLAAFGLDRASLRSPGALATPQRQLLPRHGPPCRWVSKPCRDLVPIPNLPLENLKTLEPETANSPVMSPVHGETTGGLTSHFFRPMKWHSPAICSRRWNDFLEMRQWCCPTIRDFFLFSIPL